MRVPRHEIPADAIEPRLGTTREGIPKFIAGARRDPNNLPLLLSNALDVAAGLSVIEPGSPEIPRALTLATQAASLLFAVGASEGRPVRGELGDSGPVEYTRGRVDGSLIHSARWVTAAALAVLTRDLDSIDRLCGVPTERLSASSTKCAEYVHLTVDALRNMLSDKGQPAATGGLILQAMQATDPERPDVRAPDWTLHLDVPFLELPFFLHRKEADEFAPRLGKALELHRKYWSSDEGHQRNWDGFLAIRLLGLAAFAHERDMAFEVDSEYLPMSLVRGDA